MSGVEVWLYASDNSTLVGVLEQAYGVRYGDVLSGLGSGSFSIPLGPSFTVTDGAILFGADVFWGINATDVALASTVTVTDKAALIEGGQIARLRIDNTWVGAFVIEALDTPDVLEQRVLTCSGRTLLGLYERGIVYPSDTADWSTIQTQYLTKTFAYILLDLAAAATARGVSLPTDDFSSTTDSDSQAWTDSNTVSYRSGTTLLEVIRQHADLGIEVTMGPTSVLHYYKPGGAGQDRSATVRFREGLNVRKAGRKQDYADIANAVLGQGQYIMSAQTDATSIAAYGRRERLAQHGNVSNGTTLATLTQASRDAWKDPVTSITLSVTAGSGDPAGTYQPFVDYGLGDTVTVILPSDGLSTSYRIRGIALASEGTDVQVQLTLNSLADEYLLQMDQALRRQLFSPVTAVISPNSDPNIGGWLLSTTQLSAASGAAILHSTGYLQLGTGSDIVRLDAVDATYRIWVGSATAASAPFRVTKAGALTATGATISGAITSTSGAIAGWDIAPTTLSKNNATLDSGGALTLGTSNDIVKLSSVDGTYRLWIGHATAASAPFRVTKAGAVTATSATITGSVTSTSGAIGGWTLAATSLAGGNATLSSTGFLSLGTADDIVFLSAADATYRLWIGNATAGSAAFRVSKAGAVTATSGAIGGWTLGATSLTGGDATLASSGNLTLGTVNDVVRLSSDDATYRLWIGNATAASAPFRVTKAGYMTAISGNVGGFTLSGSSFYNGNFKLDATNKRLYVDTSNYVGYAGGYMDFNGQCAFNDDIYVKNGLDVGLSGGSGKFRVNLTVYNNFAHGATAGAKLGFFGATTVTQKTGWNPTNETTDRAWDCNSTTLDELADVVATLVNDLIAYGLIGA